MPNWAKWFGGEGLNPEEKKIFYAEVKNEGSSKETPKGSPPVQQEKTAKERVDAYRASSDAKQKEGWFSENSPEPQNLPEQAFQPDDTLEGVRHGDEMHEAGWMVQDHLESEHQRSESANAKPDKDYYSRGEGPNRIDYKRQRSSAKGSENIISRPFEATEGEQNVINP